MRKSISADRRLIAVLICILLVTLSLAGFLNTIQTAQAATPGAPGTPITGAPGVTETTGQIMSRQAEIDKGPKRTPPERPEFDADLLLDRGPNPNSLNMTQVIRRNGPDIFYSSPKVAQTTGTNGNGPGFGDTIGYFPPDSMGAIGPTQFIAIVNGRIRSYNKSSGAADNALNADTDTFFQSVRSSSTSDPHIRYDRLSQRWFVIMIDVTFPNNRVMVAVSNGATVTSSSAWTFYYFPDGVGGTNADCLGDYPTPGIDANAIYIGINQFCGSSLNTASYRTSDGFVVRKTSVLSGGPIVVTPLRNLVNSSFTGPYTPQGVDNYDPAATEGYFIGVDGAVSGKLQLRRVSNPGGTPSVSSNISINVANTSQPLTQPHKGNTGGSNGQLDGSDGRIFAAHYRNGNLWIALDTRADINCTGSGSGDRDAVFWWSLTGIPTGSTPSIAQSGAVCDSVNASNPNFYTYGTIMVNGQGNAAVGFTVAGANNYASAGTAGRLVGDPSGALQPVNVYGPGAAAYNPPGDSGANNGYRRWGDYSFTSLDPCDDMTMWTIQEYTGSLNTWGTRFVQLKALPPNAPSSASPSTVAAGQSSVNVSLIGSNYYDTPATLTDPCRRRLSAAVTGGVKVNSVTYNSSISVTLNISTVGATAGTQTITLTNPDGQSVSAAILTISGSTATNTPVPTFQPPTNTPSGPTNTPVPPTVTPVSTTLFSTGLESGQPQPTWSNTVETQSGGISNVGGICCGLTGPELGVRNETTHAGTAALMYSGLDNSATSSFAYLKVFDVSAQNIAITSTTKLSYWIFPQSSATSNLVSGSNSSCVAIDMVFTDGSALRDSGVTDQTGDKLHPASQCGHLTMDAWNNVTANLGVLSGKTIARIIVAYDQSANTGGYRGYMDDIAISNGASLPTATPILPTNTSMPPTNTSVPPTNTPVPPTKTPIPPTNTPVPPTKTPTPVPPTATPGSTMLFSTGLESGQPQPTWSNTVETQNGGLSNVGGICCGLTAPELGTRNETAHAGTVALMYSGLDNSATSSYAYLKVFDVSAQNIAITSTTKLSYWIFPQSSATSNLVSGSNSSCVAIDLVFTDGSNLRDSGVTDQTGDRVHPASQCGHLTMDAWNNVTANLGVLSGKTIARIIVAYDQPANTGGYRGYVDDIAITK